MFHKIKSAFEETPDESIPEEKPIMATKLFVSEDLDKNFSLTEAFPGGHYCD